MTCQRFLYKLFWRRLGIPLILGCGLVAMVTTFYHHSKYVIVEAPPNTQKNHPSGVKQGEHVIKRLAQRDDNIARQAQQTLDTHVKDYVAKIKEGGRVMRDISSEDRNLHGKKPEEFAQVVDKSNLQDKQSRSRPKKKKTRKKENEKGVGKTVLQHNDRNNGLGGPDLKQPRKKINTQEGQAVVTEKSRILVQEARGLAEQEVVKNDKAIISRNVDAPDDNYRQNNGLRSNKHPSHRNKSEQHASKFQKFHDAKHEQTELKVDSKKLNQSRIVLTIGKNNSKNGYGIPDSPNNYKRDELQLKQAHNVVLNNVNDKLLEKEDGGRVKAVDSNIDVYRNQHNVVVNDVHDNLLHKEKGEIVKPIESNKVLYDLPKLQNDGDMNSNKEQNPDSLEEIHRKQIETNVILPLPGRSDSENNPASDISMQTASPDSNDYRIKPADFTDWLQSKQTFCSGRMMAYFNEFVHLRDVILDKAYFIGRQGGEEINEVLNQPEEDEYYKYELGCFQLACDARPDYFFNGGYHLSEFMFNLQTTDVSNRVNEVEKGFTVVVTRYEYANIYHTMTDWYNAFLMMKFFNKTREETHILIVDSHPKGALDSTWSKLFSSSVRLSELKRRTLYADMVWSILGYDSLMFNHFLESLPLIDEFHHFFLSGFNLETKKQLDCDRVKIMFIWRKDYLAHPRNPSGTLSRKIKNEKELVKSVRRKYPDFVVDGVQIDLFPMEKQLELIAQTDILIGMHGAGLTHAMFLPQHAGLIELVPSYWASSMDHFMAIAQWRHLHYERWVNNDPHDEVPNESTLVPPGVVQVFIKSILRKMKCIEELDGAQYNGS